MERALQNYKTTMIAIGALFLRENKLKPLNRSLDFCIVTTRRDTDGLSPETGGKTSCSSWIVRSWKKVDKIWVSKRSSWPFNSVWKRIHPRKKNEDEEHKWDVRQRLVIEYQHQPLLWCAREVWRPQFCGVVRPKLYNQGSQAGRTQRCQINGYKG